jgi:hypothetical protein
MGQPHHFGSSFPARDLALQLQFERAQESQRRLIEAMQFAISGFAVVQDNCAERDIKRLAATNIRSLQDAIAAAARGYYDRW